MTRPLQARDEPGVRIVFPDYRAADEISGHGFANYEAFVNCNRGEIVSTTSHSQTRRIRISNDSGNRDVYLKVYNFAGRPLRVRLGRAKPLTEARNYATLHRLGIAAPRVLAYGRRRRNGMLLDGFIMTRGVSDAVSLEHFFRRNGTDLNHHKQVAMRRAIMTVLAGLVRRMHASDFYHIDLQWRNILLSFSDADKPMLCILDCVRGGIRRSSLMKQHGMLRDLSGLHKEARNHLSRADQVRWLREYFGVSRLTCEHRSIIRSILRDREIKSPEARS